MYLNIPKSEVIKSVEWVEDFSAIVANSSKSEIAKHWEVIELFRIWSGEKASEWEPSDC